MATLSLNVPAIGLKSPSDYKSPLFLKQLRNINSKYGSFFDFAAEATRMNKKVLIAFCAIESGGDPLAGGSGSVTQGLMQWNRNFMKAQLEDEFKRKRLSPAEISFLKKYGITFDANGKTRTITQADQIKPELNIYLGAMLLGQLSDEAWARTGNALRLDRMIAVYNAGAFGETGKAARSGKYETPAQLAAVVNPVTRAYIGKMLGENGALHTLTTTLANEV